MVSAYSLRGEKLWELSSDFYTRCAGALPSADGAEINVVEEVFKLDPDADNSGCDADYRQSEKNEKLTGDVIGLCVYLNKS